METTEISTRVTKTDITFLVR